MSGSQFEDVKARYEGATRAPLPSGAALITVPGFPVSAGWTTDRTTVRFIEPNGYPYANPDCFWVEGDLRLANGAMPQNTNMMAIPEANINGLLWFSWHISEPWNPNRDSLLSWLSCVGDRFRKLQ